MILKQKNIFFFKIYFLCNSTAMEPGFCREFFLFGILFQFAFQCYELFSIISALFGIGSRLKMVKFVHASSFTAMSL